MRSSRLPWLLLLAPLVGQNPLTKTEVKVSGVELGFPSSVAMDAGGSIYILHRTETGDPVVVVDKTGHVLRSWGKGLFKIPHSIRVDPHGNIWTVDAASSHVLEFTPQGKQLLKIEVGGQPAGKTQFTGTTDIAFGPNGHLFISDGYGNARILEYSATGQRLREWGSAGSGPGQFKQPHGIAIDENGMLYVADRQNGRLQRFDLQGKYLGEFADLGMVTSVATRPGELWVGTQPRDQPTSADGSILKIDRQTGHVLARMESFHGHHCINLTGDGGVLSGARPDTVLWFRKQ